MQKLAILSNRHVGRWKTLQTKIATTDMYNAMRLWCGIVPTENAFSEDHILAPRGCCATKFLHALENDQVLLAQTPPWWGSPLQHFFKVESKIALKCSVLDEGSLEPKEVASWDFATWRAARWGRQRGYNFWGYRPLKILEDRKRAKIGAIYDNFRVWAQISRKPIKISTKVKWRWRERSFRRWTKKFFVKFRPQPTKL